jgi:SAM-dependent methyltransferase
MFFCIERIGIIIDTPAPEEEDIFRRYFLGKSVVNVGPESHSFLDGFSGLSSYFTKDNIATVLRQRGINAFAVSPRTGIAQYDAVFDSPESIFRVGSDKQMPFDDSSQDVIITMSLYDTFYYELVMGNNVKAYKDAAREMGRVLKPGGLLLIHALQPNPVLVEALWDAGFVVNDLSPYAPACYVCTNDKPPVSAGQLFDTNSAGLGPSISPALFNVCPEAAPVSGISFARLAIDSAA